jgi:hypothetical protein
MFWSKVRAFFDGRAETPQRASEQVPLSAPRLSRVYILNFERRVCGIVACEARPVSRVLRCLDAEIHSTYALCIMFRLSVLLLV